jgi:hypothetical protein
MEGQGSDLAALAHSATLLQTVKVTNTISFVIVISLLIEAVQYTNGKGKIFQLLCV